MTLRAAGPAGLLLLATTALVRRRATIRHVAPALRSRALYVPLAIPHPVVLRGVRRIYQGASPVRAGVSVERRLVPGTPVAPAVPVHVYRPEHLEAPTGALLWIHGGGTIMGHAELDHAWCSEIAERLGLVVVNVSYRLAPENPFPAPLDDCFSALRWLHDAAHELGVDPARIAVGGASAGGGLAAALCQRALDSGTLPVAFQLLVYPMIDDRTCLRRGLGQQGKILWTPTSNRFAWTCYLGHRPTPVEPRPYAAAARREDLSGLPPAWIGVGDLDLFHDEDVDYAERLRAAGVPCDLVVEKGMFHGADSSPTLLHFNEAKLAALARALDVEVAPLSRA